MGTHAADVKSQTSKTPNELASNAGFLALGKAMLAERNAPDVQGVEVPLFHIMVHEESACNPGFGAIDKEVWVSQDSGEDATSEEAKSLDAICPGASHGDLASLPCTDGDGDEDGELFVLVPVVVRTEHHQTFLTRRAAEAYIEKETSSLDNPTIEVVEGRSHPEFSALREAAISQALHHADAD